MASVRVPNNYWFSDAVQFPDAVTQPSVSVPGHLPGLEPLGH